MQFKLDARAYRQLASWSYFKMANMAKDLADAAEWIAELELHGEQVAFYGGHWHGVNHWGFRCR